MVIKLFFSEFTRLAIFDAELVLWPIMCIDSGLWFITYDNDVTECLHLQSNLCKMITVSYLSAQTGHLVVSGKMIVTGSTALCPLSQYDYYPLMIKKERSQHQCRAIKGPESPDVVKISISPYVQRKTKCIKICWVLTQREMTYNRLLNRPSFHQCDFMISVIAPVYGYCLK